MWDLRGRRTRSVQLPDSVAAFVHGQHFRAGVLLRFAPRASALTTISRSQCWRRSPGCCLTGRRRHCVARCAARSRWDPRHQQCRFAWRSSSGGQCVGRLLRRRNADLQRAAPPVKPRVSTERRQPPARDELRQRRRRTHGLLDSHDEEEDSPVCAAREEQEQRLRQTARLPHSPHDQHPVVAELRPRLRGKGASSAVSRLPEGIGTLTVSRSARGRADPSARRCSSANESEATPPAGSDREGESCVGATRRRLRGAAFAKQPFATSRILATDGRRSR